MGTRENASFAVHDHEFRRDSELGGGRSFESDPQTPSPWNQNLRKNFMELLHSASVPLYQMIWYWIVMGTIKDPYNEFFIFENAEYSKTKAWQCQFSLRKEYVPRSLEGMTAQLILDVGKCMHFINKFYPEKALHLAANKKGVFDIESCNLNSFVNEDGKPVLKLRQMYSESSELVLDIMKSKYKLKDFFNQLHEYIFLRQGHFACYFMELMHPYLYRPVSNVPSSHVKKLLHKAMKACSHRPSDRSVFDNIEVFYNEYTEDDNVVDVFALHYKMEGPIKIMFQIFDLSYRKLFMFLWRKNHVLYTMSNTWKLMRSLLKMKCLPAVSEVRDSLQRLFTMNFQLMRFMYQIDFYVVYEVIGKNAKEFFEKLETTRAIDDVVDAHAKMLRFILLGTLLDPEHTELRAQLTNIFSLVMEIEGLTISLVEYIEDLGEGYDDESLKTVFTAKVEILAKNNEMALKDFIVFLKSCKHTDGLNAVSDRIDYNEFYQLQQ
uniref:Uncharacterized protein n=1 Tax=Lygus hesperus TaxID=30085 RepID=A0A0A9XQM7_LYGHE